MKFPMPPAPTLIVAMSPPRYRVATISDSIAMPIMNSPPTPMPTMKRLTSSISKFGEAALSRPPSV